MLIPGLGQIDKFPDYCPFCHKSILPIYLSSHVLKIDIIEIFFHCPDHQCNRGFLSYYEKDYGTGEFLYRSSSIGTWEMPKHSEYISKNYSDFMKIYNDAFQAEQMELTEICGVGYRKALEFLIKDYLVKFQPDQRSNIETKTLGQCINEYVDNNNIKSSAQRATWLGNDETHYKRKWEGSTLEDLKHLIQLTLHWIEAENLTEIMITKMPEGK